MEYQKDLLADGFEQIQETFLEDYEGAVVSTLIRKLVAVRSTRAVLYIHGFNDYFFQEEMAQEYLAHGYNFYALDLRKYGRSYLDHQKFNNVRNLEEYYSEITWALQKIREEGNSFTLLSGHSMGGLLVCLYANDFAQKPLFNALFLNSPFFELNENRLMRFLAPKIAKLGKHFPNLSIQGGFSPWYGISLHEKDRGNWNYHLPWKPHEAPKVNLGWLNAICSAQLRIKNGIGIQCPVLVLHSLKSSLVKSWDSKVLESDIILNVDHIVQFSKNIGHSVTVEAIAGGVHDLMLSAPEVRRVVYEKLFSWLK